MEELIGHTAEAELPHIVIPRVTEEKPGDTDPILATNMWIMTAPGGLMTACPAIRLQSLFPPDIRSTEVDILHFIIIWSGGQNGQNGVIHRPRPMRIRMWKQECFIVIDDRNQIFLTKNSNEIF